MVNWTKQRQMQPHEYRAVIGRLGLSQAAMGRFLGISERTSRRYAMGIAVIPPAQVLLLRAILASGKRRLYVPPRRQVTRAMQ